MSKSDETEKDKKNLYKKLRNKITLILGTGTPYHGSMFNGHEVTIDDVYVLGSKKNGTSKYQIIVKQTDSKGITFLDVTEENDNITIKNFNDGPWQMTIDKEAVRINNIIRNRRVHLNKVN